jgi:hypothetical protein
MPQYTPITSVESNAHVSMAGVIGRSGIYPSGEAHFFDLAQNAVDITAASRASIFDFNLLNSQFSNATESYVIDDFTIFNPYIHNSGDYRVNVAQLLNVAVDRYNIYSLTFRSRPTT